MTLSCKKISRSCQRIVVGDPLDPRTNMGPLVSKEHADNVMRYIESGINEGATLQLGGKRLTDPPYDKGNFILPTVFTMLPRI
jgi:betaine-aldehyde dehydrogenase